MPGVLHWGPLIAISIITIVSITSTYSALQLWSLPRSVVKYFRGTHFVLMYIWLVPIFWNFTSAMRVAGYVPLKWKPTKKSDEKYLQYCTVCQGFKAPRSHHCKQCKRCVTKMDHHCPWINSCVGHGNQTAFIRFLFFVPFGCIHGTIINANFIYRLANYSFFYYKPTYDITSFWVIFTIAGISLGIGTAFGVTILLAVQMKSVFTNRTQIEDWIIDKAKHRRSHDKSLKPFVFPYYLGLRKNFTQVINWSGRCRGNGLEWETRDGCFEFAFTMEQIEQKKLKRKQAITCQVKQEFNGSSCGLKYGLITCLCMPRCGEQPIRVQTGDIVVITRWGKRWVYGDRKLPQAMVEKGLGERGWFPRSCVLPLDNVTNGDNTSDNTETESGTESTQSDIPVQPQQTDSGESKKIKGKAKSKAKTKQN